MKSILSLLLLSFVIFNTPAIAQRQIVEPEWTFEDSFNGTLNTTFWLSGIYTEYAVSDLTNPLNKVLTMKYVPNSEGEGDSWSEYDFKLGIRAKQLTLSFDIYVPQNYVHIEHNHKLFYLWSGAYGTSTANLSLNSEMWGVVGGASPSVYIGVDGQNYGHAMLKGTPLILEDRKGAWVHIDVYVELATEKGKFGVLEIYKDGHYFTGTHHPGLEKPYTSAPAGKNLIGFSERGNYIDQGTLLGWANGADNGGFNEETKFMIDNFKIAARSEVGAATSTRPLPPASIFKLQN